MTNLERKMKKAPVGYGVKSLYRDQYNELVNVFENCDPAGRKAQALMEALDAFEMAQHIKNILDGQAELKLECAEVVPEGKFTSGTFVAIPQRA